jgi:predicted dehydrogenase
VLRIGIAGCGLAARTHLARLLALDGVRVVGCADPDPAAARALAGLVPPGPDGGAATFPDHKELLAAAAPDALAIFTPHRRHYRIAMDALQAGCHVFIEKPLSIDAQEAADVIGLARGRKRKVGVGHQYRLRPSLVEARRRVLDGAIGPLRLVQATLAAPWLAAHGGAEDAWRFDAKATGGGILFDAGDHLVDALLWTTGRPAVEVAAIQVRLDSGADVVTAAALRLADGTPATLGISGVSPGSIFALTYFGERGRLRATADSLIEEPAEGPSVEVALPAAAENIDGNFVAAVTGDAPLCCPADQALETVRLLEAIGRAGASGQVVRLA